MTRKTALAFGVGASFLLAAGAASAAGTCATEVQALQEQLGMTDSANARTGPTDPGVQQPSPSASAETGSTTTGTSDQVANSTGTSTGTSTSADGNSNMTNNENTGANATIGPSDPGVQQPSPEADATAGTDSSTTTDTTTDTTTGTTADTTTTDTTTGATADSSTSADGNSNMTNNENTGANATIGPSDPGVQQPGTTDMSATGGTSTESSGSTSTGSSGTMTGSTGTVTETSRVGEMDTAAGGRAAALASLKKAQLYADAGQEEACMTELSTAKQHMGVE